MLEEIINQQNSVVSRRQAIEILKTESHRNWYDDWILAVLVVLYGVLVSSYGYEALSVYLCLGTCIATVSYRANRKSAMIARAALALVDSGGCISGHDTDGAVNTTAQSTASPSSGL